MLSVGKSSGPKCQAGVETTIWSVRVACFGFGNGADRVATIEPPLPVVSPTMEIGPLAADQLTPAWQGGSGMQPLSKS